MTRKDALAELIATLEAGQPYETAGHTMLCQKAFPKPADFDGSREAYANSPAQQAILVWRNGSLDAAKALHDAVLPDYGAGIGLPATKEYCAELFDENDESSFFGFSDNPARAWLLAQLRALHAQEAAE